MIGLLRAAVLGFALLTALYWLVRVYAKSLRRERLEKSWDSDPAREGLPQAERDAYIAAGMAEWHRSGKRWLFLLVYLVPMAVFLGTVYAVNWD